jgi:hypothetical protein
MKVKKLQLYIHLPCILNYSHKLIIALHSTIDGQTVDPDAVEMLMVQVSVLQGATPPGVSDRYTRRVLESKLSIASYCHY